MRSSFADPTALVVAPATVPGDGARAIVRLSGEGLARLLGELLVPEPADAFARPGPPRRVAARLGGDLAAAWGAVLVEVLWWPGPGGPTGGPLAELQLPAAVPLVEAVVAVACRHGARLARGGEFTLRSFLAGRLDLVQAEAVLAVVEARTPEELSLALDRMGGGAGRRLRDVRETLLDLLADIEAAIDFSDEHSPDHVAPADAAFWHDVAGRLGAARAALAAVAAELDARDAAPGGLPRVVLLGRANIGKSSLFNALVGNARALVADESGTTRDWIGCRLEGEGTACLLVDLAGVEAGGDGAGAGIAAAARAVVAAEVAAADVVVVCRDAAEASEPPATPAAVPRIDVVTRADRAARAPAMRGAIATSVRDGRGIEELRRAILAAVAGLPGRSATATLRMRVGIEAAGEAIAAAVGEAESPLHDEGMVAGFVGRAVAAVGAVTGLDLAADLLDRIFERHCIGK